MSEKWKRDTGILCALVFLLLGYRFDTRFLLVSVVFLLAVLFVPALVTPVAYMWQRLAEVLGFVMNKVFFGLVFFAVVTPVRVLRGWFSKDSFALPFGNGTPSAFIERSHVWGKDDLAAPY